MNETSGVDAAVPVPAQQRPLDRTGDLLDAALRYAEERHWDVVPGTWLEDAADDTPGRRCSCHDASCTAPGAHPARRTWKSEATASAVTVRKLWSRQPDAAVLLPTGRSFDVIDVPETAGCLALARLERTDVPLGPIACTPARRMLFFVLPGASAKTPDLLRKQGYARTAIDLVVHGPNAWVPAPPTRLGLLGGVQWARRPTVANAWLPDLDDLIEHLAYACGRDRAAVRSR